ncbi:hypothetical protein NMG60_11033107 [Bertholletia excelsa]
MRQSILMRVLFCKIHCPSFICFCKPSVAHLYNPGPLKLENNTHVPSTVVSVVTDTSDQLPGDEVIEVKEEGGDGSQQAEIGRKSCIRKVASEPKEVEKKKVQWMDDLGKELVEIQEFESSDTEDTDNEQENRGCACIIL